MTTPETPPAAPGRHAQFEASENEGQPVSFSIGDETFECCAIAPAGLLAHLVRISGKTIWVEESIQFIEEALKDDQLERFRAVIHRKNPVVPNSMITNIVEFLMVTYSGLSFPAPSS